MEFFLVMCDGFLNLSGNGGDGRRWMERGGEEGGREEERVKF